MKKLEGTLSVIARAQDGDDLAITELINLIKVNHMQRHVWMYYGRNVLIDNDEIESEFLLGVWKALDKADLYIGNPLNYLCRKGQWAVQTLFRNRIRRETRYQCLECNSTGTMGWKYKVPVCTKCQSRDIETWMVLNADTVGDDISLINLYTGTSSETAWQLAVYGIQIEELRERLSGRTRDLFDVIIIEGINRDSSRNYLQEIANQWGTSTTAVAAALRRLRREVGFYFAEEE